MMKLCYFNNNLFFSSYVCRWHDHGSTLCVWWWRWKRSINDVWREDADSLSATFTAEWRRSSSGFLKYPTLQCTVLCSAQCSAAHSALQCTVLCSAQCSVAHSALQCTVLCSTQFQIQNTFLALAGTPELLHISDKVIQLHCSEWNVQVCGRIDMQICAVCTCVTTLHYTVYSIQYTERWYEPRCLSFSTFLHIFLTVLQPLDARIRSHRNLKLKVGTCSSTPFKTANAVPCHYLLNSWIHW